MQGMLDTLSSPVAFATAPIGNPETNDVPDSSPNGSAANLLSRVSSGASIKKDSTFGNLDTTEVDEPILARLGRRLGQAKESITQNYSQRNSHSNVAEGDDEDFDESLFDDGKSLLRNLKAHVADPD
jgi:hypothetical protein